MRFKNGKIIRMFPNAELKEMAQRIIDEKGDLMLMRVDGVWKVWGTNDSKL